MKIFIFHIFITLSYLIPLVLSGAVDFRRCDGVISTGTVYNVIIPSCARIPCIFHKGQNYSIEIDFDNNRDTSSLSTEVFGILYGAEAPWPGLDPNGCKYMEVGACPLQNKDYVTFIMPLPVSLGYPTVDVILKWLIRGDDGNPIFCFTVPVSVM